VPAILRIRTSSDSRRVWFASCPAEARAYRQRDGIADRLLWRWKICAHAGTCYFGLCRQRPMLRADPPSTEICLPPNCCRGRLKFMLPVPVVVSR